MIKLYYFPVLGTIITDKSNDKMYLFNSQPPTPKGVGLPNSLI